MADSIDVDFTELIDLAEDFEALAVGLARFIPKAVEVSARKVKDHARDAVGGRAFFKAASRAIDYEMLGSAGSTSSVDAEIGYNKGKRGGALGNLAEYGAPNAPRMMNVRGRDGKWKTVPVPGGGKRPLPPGGELQKALKATEEDFLRGIEKAVDDAMSRYFL